MFLDHQLLSLEFAQYEVAVFCHHLGALGRRRARRQMLTLGLGGSSALRGQQRGQKKDRDTGSNLLASNAESKEKERENVTKKELSLKERM